MNHYITFIGGYKTQETAPDPLTDYERYSQWFDVMYVSKSFIGRLKPETIKRRAAALGIVKNLEVKYHSFDQSDKGRHIYTDVVVSV